MGLLSKYIGYLFDQFKINQNIISVSRVGEESSNGFILKLSYQVENYNASAIFKTPARVNSDNTYYEYMIGLELNKYLFKTPTFLQTYALYEYNDIECWESIKDSHSIEPQKLEECVSEFAFGTSDDNIIKSCGVNSRLGIMIQNLENSDTLTKMLNDKEFVKNECHSICFQVYAALYMLNGNFIHRDLNTNNVLVYNPLEGTYIRYHYHFRGKNVVFDTQYMAKIIDYGKSYTRNTEAMFADSIREKKVCGENYRDFGYGQLTYPIDTTQDTRLLLQLRSSTVFDEFPDFFKEILSSSGRHDSSLDIFRKLFDVMEQLNLQTSQLFGLKKIGDLHIYVDTSKDMVFQENFHLVPVSPLSQLESKSHFGWNNGRIIFEMGNGKIKSNKKRKNKRSKKKRSKKKRSKK